MRLSRRWQPVLIRDNASQIRSLPEAKPKGDWESHTPVLRIAAPRANL